MDTDAPFVMQREAANFASRKKKNKEKNTNLLQQICLNIGRDWLSNCLSNS